jgi:hypothetical protein
MRTTVTCGPINTTTNTNNYLINQVTPRMMKSFSKRFELGVIVLSVSVGIVFSFFSSKRSIDIVPHLRKQPAFLREVLRG